jgi:hypothetical protein
MGSNWLRLRKHQMSLNSILCRGNMFTCFYHSVNGISYGLAQSEPIKQCQLHYEIVLAIILYCRYRYNNLLYYLGVYTIILNYRCLYSEVLLFQLSSFQGTIEVTAIFLSRFWLAAKWELKETYSIS